MAFAPVRAKLYLADLGTDVSSITGTSVVPASFNDLGAISLSSGYAFNPAGAPTRTVEREFYDDQAFFVSESPSDDLPYWDITFDESNIDVIEAGFGVTIDEDGKLRYLGGIPPHKCMIFDAADAAASPKTQRSLVPDVSISINGSVNPQGSAKLQKYPLRFTANPTEALDGAMFDQWSSWLTDQS
jgi:hypothetical protein